MTDVYAVIWIDLLLGPLHLIKPNAAEAINLAQSIKANGDGTVSNVRAVHLPAGEDETLIDLLPA